MRCCFTHVCREESFLVETSIRRSSLLASLQAGSCSLHQCVALLCPPLQSFYGMPQAAFTAVLQFAGQAYISTSAIPCAAKETRSDLQRSCKKSEEPHSCHGLLSNVRSVLLAHVDKGVHLIALHDLQSKESLKHQIFSSCSSRTSQQHCLNYRQHTNAIPHITVYARLLGIAEESTPDQPCRRLGQYGRHSLS